MEAAFLFGAIAVSDISAFTGAGPFDDDDQGRTFWRTERADNEDVAVSFVPAALTMTEAIANRQIVDEGKFQEGLGKVIDGTVQCLKSSPWAKAK